MANTKKTNRKNGLVHHMDRVILSTLDHVRAHLRMKQVYMVSFECNLERVKELWYNYLQVLYNPQLMLRTITYFSIVIIIIVLHNGEHIIFIFHTTPQRVQPLPTTGSPITLLPLPPTTLPIWSQSWKAYTTTTRSVDNPEQLGYVGIWVRVIFWLAGSLPTLTFEMFILSILYI